MKALARCLLAVYDCTVFYLGVIEFVLLSMLWSALAGLLHMILPRELGTRVGRYGIMMGFRILLASLSLSGRFRFDLKALDALRNERGLIIAPNHPTLWDAVLMASRLPDVACIMKAAIVNDIFVGGGARLARYIRNDSIRSMIHLAIDELRNGGNVLLFPEGTRTVAPARIGELRGSIGVIASRAHVPVQTVLAETDSPFLTKGWPFFKKPRMPVHYQVRLGRRFDAPENSAALVAAMSAYFEDTLAAEPIRSIVSADSESAHEGYAK
ncbi:lysophospholipid acyltransferase family protein [Noviherbaspirillum pedocola]|uniref:1-acyl-sn-glycerol-3-phosphate acyltransferase n=1 Tax=Noviherbaspirillum pedocola TaxID=2801341 RepID=A0A934T1C8_9BURK|nr:lysophospholipid acyltransferase family protein [Noviherbaspirillum pedocola]MBK4738981.1 1-acyl-sn-glycerol-3-phosphate acyltransferase [Noviherbaspirillum pedocola]